MRSNKTNFYNFKMVFFMRLILIFLFVVCASCATKTEKSNVANGSNQEVAGFSSSLKDALSKPHECTARDHPTKTSPTADYQACRYNNKGDEVKISRCMRKLGWSRMKKMTCQGGMHYSDFDILSCMKSSMVNEKVDYAAMNLCLDSKEKNDTDGIGSLRRVN